MNPASPPSAHPSPVLVGVVGACTASAGAHAALVAQHLEHEPSLAIAFIAAASLLAAVATALVHTPADAHSARSAAVVLAALIGAYALNVTTGIPWLTHGPESLDAVGLATKAVEAIGLLFSIQLTTTTGGRYPLAHKEART